MNEDNIYDVEKFEDVNSDNESLTNEESNNEEQSFEKESYIHPINDISNKPKAKRKKGAFKFIALAVIAGLLGGAIGGGSTYYVMKSYINNFIT